MNRLCATAIVGAMGLFSVQAIHAAPDAKAFVGRWNIHIQNTGDTFQTAWLKVTERGDALGGALVWKWGSVVPLSNVTVEDGELRFTRGNGGNLFSARLVGDELHGAMKPRKGRERKFIGRRATEMTDVTGTWNVGLAENPDAPKASLVLKTSDGRITGRATDPDGNNYAIKDASVHGYVLEFKAFPKEDGVPRDVHCEVRGDRLLGKVTVTLPGEETRVIPIRGERARAWGKPVRLLKENSLDGWGPRDPKRKFGWKVKDGVLENTPPDVDIVSEAKFRDFRLQLEYKVDPKSNSGVYLRGRYELQILGDTRIQKHGNMAVYSRLSPQTNPIKLGEWNKLDVTFIGRWLTVVLNGETVYDNQYLEGTTGGAWDEKEEAPGSLLLQGDHGKVRFRNIVVTPVE